jgi:phage FluMu protein Com
MPLPEGFIPFDRLKYEQAIAAAPPGTMIKLGDLERPMVRCTTCNGEMDEAAAQFHKHPKKCGACGNHFDENMEKHTPIHVSEQRGGGTIGFTSGCKKESL